MDLPYKQFEQIETLAKEIKDFYKFYPKDFMDAYDYETISVMIDKCNTIINEANWCQHQSKDFVETQTNKVFDSLIEEA